MTILGNNINNESIMEEVNICFENEVLINNNNLIAPIHKEKFDDLDGESFIKIILIL